MSHTKGPWYVGTMNDGLFIIDQPPRPSNDDINPNHDTYCIASIRRVSGDFDKEFANANLIAAAPDLLDACRESLIIFNSNSTEVIETADWNRITRILKDAICKAEGEK